MKAQIECPEKLKEYLEVLNALPRFESGMEQVLFKAAAKDAIRDIEAKPGRKSSQVEAGITIDTNVVSMKIVDYVGPAKDACELWAKVAHLADEKMSFYEIVEILPRYLESEESFLELRRREVDLRLWVAGDGTFQYKIVSGLNVLELLRNVPCNRLQVCLSGACRKVFWVSRLGTKVCSKSCGTRNRVAKHRRAIYESELNNLQALLAKQMKSLKGGHPLIEQTKTKIKKLEGKIRASPDVADPN